MAAFNKSVSVGVSKKIVILGKHFAGQEGICTYIAIM